MDSRVFEESTLQACEQAVRDAVLAAAQESGAEVTAVNAELSYECDGIIIHNVCVTVSASSADKADELSLSAARLLGFPVSVAAE